MGRILVADDDADVRDVLSKMLGDEGHTVIESEDGPSTLEAILQQRPDLVLLDIEMPNLGGLEVLAKVREDPFMMATPVIIVSVRGRPSDRDRAEELDVTDYILKPWRDGEIEMRVMFALQAAVRARKAVELETGEALPPVGGPISPVPAAPVAPPPGTSPPPAFPAPAFGAPSTAPPPAFAAPVPIPVAAPVPTPAAPGQPDFTEAPLVLIVEDEEYARLPLVDCIQQAGFRTMEATDGGHVFGLVQEYKPDVVLLDLTLPRFDGLQVLRQIKGDGTLRKSSIIMVTGDTDQEIIEMCLSIGARDFVPKPWHGGDMQHRVRRAVKSSQAIAAQIEQAHSRAVARMAARPKKSKRSRRKRTRAT